MCRIRACTPHQVVCGDAQMAAFVRCSAEELKFLWAFQGAIENVMLYKCKHIATSFLEYCADQIQASSAAPVSSVRLLLGVLFGEGLQLCRPF